MSQHFLTVKQIVDACEKHKYILLTFENGHQMGVNSKVIKIAQRMKNHHHDSITRFIGFIPCDFIEYIEHKHPFIIY